MQRSIANDFGKKRDMHLKTDYLWEKGSLKEKNETSLSLQQIKIKDGEVVFAVICEGVYGLSEGETVSGMIATKMTDWFYREGIRVISGRKWKKRYERSVRRQIYLLRDEICLLGKRKGQRMGTSALVLLVKNRDYLILQWGYGQCCCLGKNRAKALVKGEHRKAAYLKRSIGSFPLASPIILKGKLTRKYPALRIGNYDFLSKAPGTKRNEDKAEVLVALSEKRCRKSK